MTNAEQRLWFRLRRGQLGARFRRQHPLGNYIADFACLAPKLIVEADGSQHATQKDHDTRREAFFSAHGFSMLRFSADAPFLNLEGVLQTIAVRLDVLRAPTPALPQKGREFNTYSFRPTP